MFLRDIVVELEIDTLADWIAVLGLLFYLLDVFERSVQKFQRVVALPSYFLQFDVLLTLNWRLF